MDMKISQKGIDLIKKFEGLRLHAYADLKEGLQSAPTRF